MIDLLLRAAVFIENEKKDTELRDHGYASPRTSFQQRQQRKPKQRTTSWSQSSGGRSLHNELEKNRRANLRSCLERLRDTIPAHGPSAKNTTLQLLKRAKVHIMNLEEQHRSYKEMIARLTEQQRELNEHLRQGSFRAEPEAFQLRGASGVSDSFGVSAAFLNDSDSSSSPASVSDSDDVDIMGSASESDDYGR